MTDKQEKENNNPFKAEESTEAVQETEQQEAIEPTEVVEEASNNEYDELKNQYVRLAADFDNYRKRQAQERESLLKYGAEDTLKKLLPAIDTFKRANESIENMEDCQKIKENFEVVKKQFFDALEKIGLQKIETVGAEFNPNFHEAVLQTPTSEQPEHTIIAELQSGYKLEDRVIRASLVNVAVSE